MDRTGRIRGSIVAVSTEAEISAAAGRLAPGPVHRRRRGTQPPANNRPGEDRVTIDYHTVPQEVFTTLGSLALDRSNRNT